MLWITFLIAQKRLQRALDFAAAQATRAHVHVANASIDHYADALRVRRPATTGLAIGVADVVAGHDALGANLTKLSHKSHLLLERKQSYNGIILSSFRGFDKYFLKPTEKNISRSLNKPGRHDHIIFLKEYSCAFGTNPVYCKLIQ